VYHRDGYRSSERICMLRLSRWVAGASCVKTPCYNVSMASQGHPTTYVSANLGKPKALCPIRIASLHRSIPPGLRESAIIEPAGLEPPWQESTKSAHQ
jgi:hypothetical protein